MLKPGALKISIPGWRGGLWGAGPQLSSLKATSSPKTLGSSSACFISSTEKPHLHSILRTKGLLRYPEGSFQKLFLFPPRYNDLFDKCV